jgi:HK97 family phage portal protein
VSILRRALGIAHEERATGVTILPGTGRRVPEPPDGYGQSGYGGWAPGMVWHASTATSGPVTTEQASRLSAVFGCWRLLSDAIASLPADTFVRDRGFRRPYRPRPGYLDFQPPQGGKIPYLCQVELSLLSDGNAFVATPRDELGVPVDLIPLDPTLIDVVRKKGVISYEALGETYGALDIMHIPGMLMPGALRGMSPIQAAREVIDGALKAQQYGASFLGNAAVPPAVIQVPGSGGDPKVEREKAKKVGQLWQETHGGSNAGRVGVLIGGAELKTIAISQKDSQWIESRQFSTTEIARFYGVPPHLIADASNSTSWGSGLAEQNQTFGSFTLQPTVERIEEGHNRLLTTHGLPQVFWKLNLDAKLRSAPKERAETFAIRIANRSMTINEARALEDQPPVPWGDDFQFLGATSAGGDGQMDVRSLAETIQKLYLGVGSVITLEEAREILNRDGADLAGPGPASGLAELVQKIYLGVGKVLTADEAREILNREGAGLTGPAPEGTP